MSDLSLEVSQVVIDGITFTGFSDDDDAISLPGEVESMNVKVGADGTRTYNLTSKAKGGEVSFKLSHKSPTVKLLQVKIIAQQNGVVAPSNGLITYSDGSKLIMSDGRLIKHPAAWSLGTSGGSTMVYVYDFSSLIFDTVSGAFYK